RSTDHVERARNECADCVEKRQGSPANDHDDGNANYNNRILTHIRGGKNVGENRDPWRSAVKGESESTRCEKRRFAHYSCHPVRRTRRKRNRRRPTPKRRRKHGQSFKSTRYQDPLC